MIDLHVCDALDGLRGLAPASVDAVITDPPYCSGGTAGRDRATGSAAGKYCQTRDGDYLGDDRDQRSFLLWSLLWMGEAFRATRPGGTIHVFSDWRQLPAVSDAIQVAGWRWLNIIPWDKGRSGTRPQHGRHRIQCEYVVFGVKGKHRPYGGAPYLDGAYAVPSVRGAAKAHFAQKPTALMRQLVQVVPPGGVVLDPFAGSGTTGIAAALEGRRAVLFEASPSNAEVAARRISAEVGR